MASIYKGDDTSAFNSAFITIKANIPEGQTVSKAKVKIDNLPVMTFTPTTEKPNIFPIRVNLSPAQTRQLSTQAICYLAVYDSQGRKATCKGVLKFVAKDEVVF